MDFVREKSDLTGLPESFFIQKIGIWPDKFISWKKRYGKANEHNGNIPRDHWLEAWEKDEIVAFYTQHQSDGYRRCTYMMIDQDVVYASPATVYRVLSNADVMRKWNRGKSSKGTGFEQPMRPHEHWHIDIANVRIKGIHYFLITILDGYSRYIVHWDLRERMKDEDIGVVQQRAKELFPGQQPRYISDNGKQFTSREFKHFIAENDLTHVTTSPYYPQSNGKLERYHKSIKSECIRVKCPLSLEEAKKVIGGYVKHYNEERLHSAIEYVTPKTKLEGREREVITKRDRKLEKRRAERKKSRQLSKKNILRVNPAG